MLTKTAFMIKLIVIIILIKNLSKTVMLLQFNIFVFRLYFIPVMDKHNFQQSLLQSFVSHDPLEFILIC